MYTHNGLAWNENEASKIYEVQEFDKFKYDNESNKIFDLIDRINSKTRDVQDDVEDVIRALNRLSNKYENCYDYDEYIKDMVQVLVFRSADLANINKSVLKNIIEAVTELIKKDKSLLADIEFFTNLLKR